MKVDWKTVAFVLDMIASLCDAAKNVIERYHTDDALME